MFNCVMCVPNLLRRYVRPVSRIINKQIGVPIRLLIENSFGQLSRWFIIPKVVILNRNIELSSKPAVPIRFADDV